jgi:acetyl esterase/lipase
VVGVVRVLAWGALLGASGLLVRAEVEQRRLPEGVSAYTDLVYRSDGTHRARLDLYAPAGAADGRPADRPAVVAIHGGGWRGGSKNSYGRMAAALAQRGYVVVAVDYQLSKPGTPSWPGNLEDLRAAVRWLRRHARVYHVNPDQIAVMGASAGGHLAALLATLADDPISPEPDSARVQAVIDFYGPSDLAVLADESPSAAGALDLLLGGAPGAFPGRYAAASPVRHVSPEDPPMLLIHGTDDRLVPLNQTRLLDEALARAGVPHRVMEVAGARHGFGLQVGTLDLVPEILAFLESAWNVKSGTSAR